MIERPERHLEAFARAGASSITVHVETCPHLHRTVQQIRELGARPSVTLNPATSQLRSLGAQVGGVLWLRIAPEAIHIMPVKGVGSDAGSSGSYAM